MKKTTTNPIADQAEATINEQCLISMNACREQAPEWFANYEDSMPDTSDRATLVDLLRTAPNDFARGVLYGKFVMRMGMAEMSGRSFN